MDSDQILQDPVATHYKSIRSNRKRKEERETKREDAGERGREMKRM